MNTRFSWFLLIALLCGAPAKAELRSDVGGCYGVRGIGHKGGDEIVCNESFPSLWLSADRDDSRYIEITGYLAYVSGWAYLFPSRDFYYYSAGHGGIRLHVEPEQEEALKKIVERGRPVTLVGLYQPAPKRGGARPMGALDVAGDKFWNPTLPNEVPDVPEPAR